MNPPAEAGFIRTGRWTRKTRAAQSWHPIHLAYLTGFLQQQGFDCGLVDACARGMGYDITYLYVTKMMQPDVVFMLWSYDLMQSDLAFADELASKCRVVLVGPWSLCAPDALLQTKKVNLMTFGEFEHTCLEILKNPNYGDIKGVIWRNHIDNTIHKNPPRPLCSTEELDAMPFVTSVYKEFLDIKLYHQTSLRYPFVDFFTARGCPNQCSYCVWIRGFQCGPSYRARSIKNTIEELWYIKNNLTEVKQIFFQDDTLPPKHAAELSQAIIDEKLNICWGGYSRAEQSFETLQLMKESGCRTLHIGYESPIQSNLTLINKGLKVEQMQEFADNIRKLGMWTSATVMLFPWMKPAEVKYTIDWAKKIRPKRMNFIQAQGYPNTPYAKTVKDMSNNNMGLMGFEEMQHWEQWGFKQFYIYNPRFLWEVIKNPSEWKNVYNDAKGLLSFLGGK